MYYHVAQLVIAVLFMILAVSALVARYWFSSFFWAFLAILVGYPLFVADSYGVR